MKKVILALMLMAAAAMVVNAQRKSHGIIVNGVENFTIDGIEYDFDIGNGEEDIDENGIIHNLFLVVHADYSHSNLLKGDNDKPIDLIIADKVEFGGEWYGVRSVNNIGGCSSLRAVIIEEGVGELNNCFNDCESLERVELPSSLESIGAQSFNNLPLLSLVNLPESLREIGYESFCDLPLLTHIKFPEALLKVGYNSFQNCGFKNLDFPYPMLLHYSCFCNLPELESISFCDEMGLLNGVFSYLPKLKSLRVPRQTTDILRGAFCYLDDLEELFLPEANFTADAFTFVSLPNLKKIYCPQQVPPEVCTNDVITGMWYYEFSSYPRDSAPIDKATCKLLVPPGCVDAYRNSRSWGCFANIEEYQFDGVDDVTVDGGDVADNPDAPCYDLYGRLVVDPAPGLYIRNGKKIVVR